MRRRFAVRWSGVRNASVTLTYPALAVRLVEIRCSMAFGLVDECVVGVQRRKVVADLPESLGMTEEEIAVLGEGVMKAFHEYAIGFDIKVDDHIAAEDDIHRRHAPPGCGGIEVKGLEGDHLAQFVT